MSGAKKIQAVTFDVGGTLIQPWPSVGEVYAKIAARHGMKVSAQELQQRFKAAWRVQKNFAYTREAWASLVDETFGELCGGPPGENFFAELYDFFAQPEAWRIFDDVLPTLEQLAVEKIRLGIISNWDERLGILLRRLDLEKYFEVIVISCDAGFAKPSPKIFAQAAEKFHLPPPAILHIGDSFELDVRGARAAGFHGLQIRRGENPMSTDVISHLGEGIARIEQPISSR
jgi:putative hydrolase of the HAD superfamily